MTKRIIFKNSDGSVGVIIPSGKVNDAFKDVPDGLTYRVVDVADVPSDRTFRGAWMDDGATVVTDMPRARVIHMDRIRGMRDIKMKELDIETMKGNNVQAQKQALRDLPSTYDLSGVNTPDELKLLIPSEVS